MHVGDTIFIFCLALIIFGPKKLPEIGRQIGKLMVEFRRASNEFKMQIEDELRASEESERQKEISAATTMLPTGAAAASSSLLEASTESNAASVPVIAPPSTGLPVNHTFNAEESTAGTCSYEATLPTASQDAYPEVANGFNAGLNTASNGLVTETPLAASTILQPEMIPPEAANSANLESGEPLAEKAQAPVHHG